METENNSELAASKSTGKSKITGIAVAVIVLLTLLAVWFVPSKTTQHADIPLPDLAVPVTPVAAEPTPTAEAVSTKPSASKEGDAARLLISEHKKNGGSMDVLFQQAEQFRLSGQLTDAYLLYFHTARLGYGNAAMMLAKQADPAYFAMGDSLLDAPDVIQAHKWYSIAAEAGNNDANERLENLHQQVEAQAAVGDLAASQLLLQWK